jgi:activator of HSP90 ATPase
MAKTIVQKIVFKSTTPKALYDLYMNAKKHSVATAAPAKISTRAGEKFATHGGYITGENILLIKDQLIVQSWRTQEWDPKEPDSTFIIELEQKGKNVTLHMVHANVPDKHAASIDSGWHTHYWGPWKLYLAGKPITKHPTM